MRDIVFPNSNEKEFIAMAEKLGYKELFFVYDSKKKFYDTKASVSIKNVWLVKKHTGESKIPTIAQCTMENVRHTLEHIRPTIIFGIEGDHYKDFIHQRASGLNHVLCKIAKKNSISVGFSFSQLLDRSGMKRAQIMGRIKQNIELCRKFDVSMIIASFAKEPTHMRTPQDLLSLFTVLGMNGGEAKKGIK